MKKKKPDNQLIRSSSVEYLTFIASTGDGGVNAIYQDENIWLSQKMMGELYQVNVRTINEHLQNIFKDSELQEDSVIRKFRITASDGKTYNTGSWPIIVGSLFLQYENRRIIWNSLRASSSFEDRSN
ncbi:hypothetical protein MASR2M12_02620 [Bacteroidales bacterium]